MTDCSKNKLIGNGYGTLVLVVGASGSGKDSVIDYAREHYASDDRVHFVRRCITRDNGDPSENHEHMPLAAFQKAEMQGKFVISWGAHGLFYGLPATLLDHLEKGGVVIANGSRKVIPVLKEQFPNFIAVNLTVEKSILAKRLLSRGRESDEEIERRLNRTDSLNESDLFGPETVHVDNSGSLETAGSSLVILIDNALS